MSDWKQELRQSIVEHETAKQTLEQEIGQQNINAQKFLQSKVIPAFEEIMAILKEQGREMTIVPGLEQVTIEVSFKGEKEIEYGVEAKLHGKSIIVSPVEFASENGRPYKAEGSFKSEGHKKISIDNLSKEEIIQDFIPKYPHSAV